MTTIVKQIEDVIIAKIKAVLGAHLRAVEWAPPDWDEDFVKRAMRALPGVFVIFEGGQRNSLTEQSIILDTQWTIAALTNHVQEAKARAQGDGLEIGCYEILETLAPQLDGFDVPDIGTLNLLAWNNSAALKLEKQALMMQDLSFGMSIELPRTLDPSQLVPFKLFHDTMNIGQLPGAPTTEDYVELEQ
jgi:phage gp37-like protein